MMIGSLKALRELEMNTIVSQRDWEGIKHTTAQSDGVDITKLSAEHGLLHLAAAHD